MLIMTYCFEAAVINGVTNFLKTISVPKFVGVDLDGKILIKDDLESPCQEITAPSEFKVCSMVQDTVQI